MDDMDRRDVGEDPTIMGNDVPRDSNLEDRDVTARPVRDDDNPTTADYVGEAAGGVSGGLAGAAIGSIAGPVGTLVGGLAGVIGGWWAGRSIAEAAKDYGDVDDRHYRTHYESARAGDRSYDDVRPAYQLGHLASRNPDYRGRSFDAVEPDLQRGWTDDISKRHGDWSSVRGYAREAYVRGSSTLAATSAGAVDSTVRTSEQLDDVGDRSAHAADRVATGIESGVDNIKDRIDGNPASKPGLDPTDARAGGRNFAERAADKVRGTDDRLADAGTNAGTGVGDAARRGANKVVDAVDNVKDRIDGNPASKPGPDPTDKRL
jgi:hypothetical protein